MSLFYAVSVPFVHFQDPDIAHISLWLPGTLDIHSTVDEDMEYVLHWCVCSCTLLSALHPTLSKLMECLAPCSAWFGEERAVGFVC